MALRRVFLGWNRPLCETVPEHLLAGSGAEMQDLRDTVAVVPTRQSSWRLRAALPLAADARGAALLGPEIVTPPVLLRPPQCAGIATALQSLLAWAAVLKNVKCGEFAVFLGARTDRPSGTAWALQLARRLQELRQELADGGFTIADVASRGSEFEEADRWANMAQLENRYRTQLASWQVRDAIDVMLEYVRRGGLPPDVRRVVVAAVPDPPKLFMMLLGRWAEAGIDVDLLIAAPESEAAAFDEQGRPLPDAWQTREIALRAEDLWLESSPDDLATRIAKAVEPSLGEKASVSAARPQLAIGVPDREAVAPLQRAFAAMGLSAFDPQNKPLSETALFRLVQALLALRDRPGYAEVSALLRHPDVLASFGGGADLLRQLDRFQTEHLPVTLDDMVSHGTPPAPQPLAEALSRLRRWQGSLRHSDLAAALRNVLQEIYAKRTLKPHDPEDDAFQQSVSAFDAGLRELEAAASAGNAGDHAAEALLARLRDSSVKSERREERLDLEGWLELAWNPAPLLFVAGVNEGYVPDSHVGDLFLPDALRRQLDLRDDRQRVARDAYVLSALLAQRRAEGRVILLTGKTSAAGDPLRPSRLLFRCPDAELVNRARLLFGEPPPSQAAAAFTVGFQLDPARVQPACLNQRRSRELSPTIFRDYLACPLRFYLKHVLDMEPLDDRAREPDARAFGTLVHDVLDEMASDKGLWRCGDANMLARRLDERLRARARERYGATPWLGVELAVDSAVRRLGAFAQKQVEWHTQGWEIVRNETEQTCVIGGVTVKGRIDRIDRNARTGAVCVLDYKTSDKAKEPKDAHLAPLREENEFLAGAKVPKDLLVGSRSDKRWADLQLPLYREFVQEEYGPSVQLGYICLPSALGETGFRIWANYTDDLHASAMTCAKEIVAKIKAGVFWPPGKLKANANDDFAGVLLGDPVKTFVPPASPWRAGP